MIAGTLEIQLLANMARLQKDMDDAKRAVGNAMQSIERSVDFAKKALGGLLGGLSVMAGINKLIGVQRQFDVLNASLVTATGSAKNAAVAFSALEEFAATTPFGLAEVTSAFVKMRNLGLDPSEKALRSYGNTASAMGKSLEQFVEAVADATTGEFERLKEFGIKASQENGKVSLTFQGVTKTIANSSEEIQKYLMAIGEVEFAGAMDERAKTLDGALSNLGDTWDGLFRSVSSQSVGGFIYQSVVLATGALEDFDRIIRAVSVSTDEAGKKSTFFASVQNGLGIVFETVTVLALNVIYVIKGIAAEIQGLGEQAMALARLDFAGAKAIGERMKADAELARAEVDAASERVLNARNVTAQATVETDRLAQFALAKGRAAADADEKNKKKQQTAAEKMIASLREQIATEQLNAAGMEKISKAQTALIKLEGELATGKDKSLKAREKEIRGQIQMLDLLERETKARAEQKRFDDERYAAVSNNIAQLDQQIDAAEREIEVIGLTAGEIQAVEAARLNDEIAIKRRALALAESNSASASYIEGLRIEIEQLEKLANLKAQGATKRTQADAAANAAAEWQRAADDINRSLTDALLRGFESGKSFAENFRDTLKNMFQTLVLRPVISMMVAPVAGLFAGMPGYASASNGQTASGSPVSGLTSLFSPGSLLNGTFNYSGAFGTAGVGASLAYGSVVPGLKVGGQQAAMLAAQTGEFGALGLQHTAQSAQYATANGLGAWFNGASGLTGLGAGIIGGLGAGAIFGNKGHSALAGGLGATAGMAIGGSTAVAGTAFGQLLGWGAGPAGAIAGMLIGGALGSLFGGGETRYGAGYGVDHNGKVFRGGGPSGGDPAAEATMEAIKATYDSIGDLAQRYGGSAADIGHFQAGYEVSPKKGNSFVYAGTVGDYERRELKGEKDAQKVIAEFQVELQRGLIRSLQESDLEKPFADYLAQFDASQLTAADVQNVLTTLESLKQFTEAMKQMPFGNVASLAGEAALELAKAAGGMDTLVSSLNTYYQTYYSETERLAYSQQQLTDQFKELGVEMPATKEAFRSVMDGLDLTSESGRELYTQLLQLAPAFAQVADAAKAAADQRQALWDNYFTATYSPEEQLAKQMTYLREQFKGLGVAMPSSLAGLRQIIENLDTRTPEVKALQDALLALAPAFAQAQQQAEQLAATQLESRRNDVSSAYEREASAIQQTIASIEDAIKANRQYRDSLLLSDLSTLSPEQKYAEARRQYEAVAAAAARGDVSAQAQLSSAADAFLQASRGYNASGEAYQRDFAKVQADLAMAISSGEAQLTLAKQQLASLDKMVSGILDVDKSVQSLADAVKAFWAAENGTPGTGTTPSGPKVVDRGGGPGSHTIDVGGGTVLTGVTDAMLEESIKKYQSWYETQKAARESLASQGITADDFATMGEWTAYLEKERQRLVNGSHANGLAYVPFDGYVAELHQGERVLTAAENRQFSMPDWSAYGRGDSGALAQEVRALRGDLAAANQRIEQLLQTRVQQAEAHHAEDMGDRVEQKRILRDTKTALEIR